MPSYEVNIENKEKVFKLEVKNDQTIMTQSGFDINPYIKTMLTNLTILCSNVIQTNLTMLTPCKKVNTIY